MRKYTNFYNFVYLTRARSPQIYKMFQGQYSSHSVSVDLVSQRQGILYENLFLSVLG